MDNISEAVESLHKRRIKRLLPIIILAAIIISGMIYFSGARDQKPEVRASSLQMGNISSVMYITAEIHPGAIVEQTIPHQQRVTEVHVRPGDQVLAGDVLLTLDTRELEDQYHQAKEARKEIEASLAKAEAAAKAQAKEAEKAMKEFEAQVHLLSESLSGAAANLALLRSISPAELNTGPDITANIAVLLAEFDPEADNADEQMQDLLEALLQGVEVTDNRQYQEILQNLENDLVNLSTSLSQVLVGLTDSVTDSLTAGLSLSPDLGGQLGALGGALSDPLTQAKQQEELARERFQHSVSQLKAKSSGVIGEVNAEVDSYIGTASAQGNNSLDSVINEALGGALGGIPSGRPPAVIIFDNTKPKAVFQVNRFDANRLDLDMPVIYEQDGETYTGVITRKARFATNSSFRSSGASDFFGEIPGVGGFSNEPQLEIEMSIEGNRLADLILGFFIDAEIVTESAENVLLLPAEAMRRELDDYYVFVIDEEGRLIRQEFEPGIQSDMFVEVVSGLTINDRVVLNPTGALEDRMLVQERSDD